MLNMRSHIISTNLFKSLKRTSYQLIITNNNATHSSHSMVLNGSRTVQRAVLFGGSSLKERTSPLTRHNAAQSSYSTPACTAKYSHPSCIHRSYSANILANSVARKSLIPHTAPCERLLWQPPCRSFLSAISTNGFNDYEIGKRDFKIDVPEYFNFAADVMDEWAKKEETGKRTSNVPAFWWVDTEGNELKWSFRDLQVKSKKVANLLSSACDIKPGDRVMVILPRIPEWWLVNLACMRTGAVLLPGTTQLRTGDIRERVQKSGSVCIITNEDMAPLVDEACVDCESLQRKVLVSDKDKQGTERSGWLDFNALFEEASEEHECVQTRSDDPMTIFFTSGTTGKPKMAEHTHASYGLGHIITDSG